jgi:hypothetical protein
MLAISPKFFNLRFIPISTAPAVEPASIDLNALGYALVSASDLKSVSACHTIFLSSLLRVVGAAVLVFTAVAIVTSFEPRAQFVLRLRVIRSGHASIRRKVVKCRRLSPLCLKHCSRAQRLTIEFGNLGLVVAGSEKVFQATHVNDKG